MQEIISPLVEFVRKEMSYANAKLNGVARDSSHPEHIAGQLHLRSLRAWSGQVFSNLRIEARREAMALGINTSLNAGPAEERRASEVFARCLLKEICMQAETIHANVQPNRLRIMAGGASRQRAEAYFSAESSYRDFLLELDSKARAAVEAAHPGVSATVRGPQIVRSEPGEQGRFVDRLGHAHPLLTANAALVRLLQGNDEPLEMYSFDLDALRTKIMAMEKDGRGTAYVSELSVPVIAYAFDTSGWPVREVRDLTLNLGQLKESPRLMLQGWGDRAGDPVLDFDRPLAVSPLMPEAPEPMDVVVDHAGHRHVMVNGATAAAMVMAGRVPEVSVAEAAIMHEALRAMGGYQEERQGKQTRSFCALPSIRYVVYDQTPRSSKWRAVSCIHHLGHVPVRRDLQGWGDQPGDPIIDPAALIENSDAVFLSSYRAVFEATGRGVLNADEVLDIDHPLTMGLVRDLRRAQISGVEVASASMELARNPAGDDENNVGVRLSLDFVGLQGYQEHTARNVMRKVVDLQLHRALADRPGHEGGRVWIGRSELKEVAPIEAVRSKMVEVSAQPAELPVATTPETGGLEP